MITNTTQIIALPIAGTSTQKHPHDLRPVVDWGEFASNSKSSSRSKSRSKRNSRSKRKSRGRSKSGSQQQKQEQEQTEEQEKVAARVTVEITRARSTGGSN